MRPEPEQLNLLDELPPFDERADEIEDSVPEGALQAFYRAVDPMNAPDRRDLTTLAQHGVTAYRVEYVRRVERRAMYSNMGSPPGGRAFWRSHGCMPRPSYAVAPRACHTSRRSRRRATAIATRRGPPRKRDPELARAA